MPGSVFGQSLADECAESYLESLRGYPRPLDDGFRAQESY